MINEIISCSSKYIFIFFIFPSAISIFNKREHLAYVNVGYIKTWLQTFFFSSSTRYLNMQDFMHDEYIQNSTLIPLRKKVLNN
jgi:hypothetical protein